MGDELRTQLLGGESDAERNERHWARVAGSGSDDEADSDDRLPHRHGRPLSVISTGSTSTAAGDDSGMAMGVLRGRKRYTSTSTDRADPVELTSFNLDDVSDAVSPAAVVVVRLVGWLVVASCLGRAAAVASASAGDALWWGRRATSWLLLCRF